MKRQAQFEFDYTTWQMMLENRPKFDKKIVKLKKIYFKKFTSLRAVYFNGTVRQRSSAHLGRSLLGVQKPV